MIRIYRIPGRFYTTDKPSDIGRVYASDGELVATVHQTKDKRIRENTRLFTAAPIGAELAEAVLALCPVSHGSGPVAPCFDEFDYEVEAKRGAWSVIDDAELEKLRALAREFQKAGDF